MANVEGPIEAVLHAGTSQTAYVRAGRGPAVLLLRCGSLAALARSEAFRELAAAFRVTGAVAPEHPDGAWLRDLIDGLGLDRPLLIADPALARFVRSFAASHPDRLAGFDILGASGDD